MLTVSQVARRLSCSEALVYQLCADGRLVHYRLGSTGRGAIRVAEDALQEFLNESLVGSPSLKTVVGLKHIRLRQAK